MSETIKNQNIIAPYFELYLDWNKAISFKELNINNSTWVVPFNGVFLFNFTSTSNNNYIRTKIKNNDSISGDNGYMYILYGSNSYFNLNNLNGLTAKKGNKFQFIGDWNSDDAKFIPFVDSSIKVLDWDEAICINYYISQNNYNNNSNLSYIAPKDGAFVSAYSTYRIDYKYPYFLQKNGANITYVKKGTILSFCDNYTWFVPFEE